MCVRVCVQIAGETVTGKRNGTIHVETWTSRVWWCLSFVVFVCRLTAVGRFVGSVHTVVIAVAHPDSRDAALSDDTLELIGCAGHFGYKTTEVETTQKHKGRRGAEGEGGDHGLCDLDL